MILARIKENIKILLWISSPWSAKLTFFSCAKDAQLNGKALAELCYNVDESLLYKTPIEHDNFRLTRAPSFFLWLINGDADDDDEAV